MSEQQRIPVREAGRAAASKVNWDTTNMKSSYANVCNVQSSREEVVLFFGVNQAWAGGEEPLTVQLTDRIILSPFAAKRLSLLLDNVLRQYEARFGSLDVATQAAPAPVTKN